MPKKGGRLNPPEAMRTKRDKEKLLEELKEKFAKAKGYILISILGLKGEEEFLIREILKNKRSSFQVAKKTLIYKSNPNFPFKEEELKTPFGFIWEFDENLSAFKSIKELKEKGINIEILKGYLEGKILNQKDVLEISEIPSKEYLLGKLLGSLKGVLYRLSFALSFPIKKLNYTLSQIKK